MPPGAPVPPGVAHSGAPGAAAPPGSLGPSGHPAAPGSYGTFDGGYAQVIRATDYPVSPAGRGRPANPARPADHARSAGPAGPAGSVPADADVFVYRDTSAQPRGQAADSPPRDPAEDDTAYWYDLLAEDAAPRREETRGPFEPLLPSGATSPASGPAPSARPGDAPAGTGPARTGPGQAPPDAEHRGGQDDTAQARARKLEQLKDLYLTAEAIGEQNVDKHFDQLLAQQRELISEYFRQSGAAQAAGAEAEPGAGPGAAQGAGVAAEQPRAS
jgi:hypothetical protein